MGSVKGFVRLAQVLGCFEWFPELVERHARLEVQLSCDAAAVVLGVEAGVDGLEYRGQVVEEAEALGAEGEGPGVHVGMWPAGEGGERVVGGGDDSARLGLAQVVQVVQLSLDGAQKLKRRLGVSGLGHG